MVRLKPGCTPDISLARRCALACNFSTSIHRSDGAWLPVSRKKELLSVILSASFIDIRLLLWSIVSRQGALNSRGSLGITECLCWNPVYCSFHVILLHFVSLQPDNAREFDCRHVRLVSVATIYWADWRSFSFLIILLGLSMMEVSYVTRHKASVSVDFISNWVWGEAH